MKEIIDLLSAKEEEQIHGSTGTVECCSNMLVQGTSDPTTAERKAYWTIVQNLAEEASLYSFIVLKIVWRLNPLLRL